MRQIQLGSNTFYAPMFSYQFRTEAPSIARMQSERRIAIEYENISSLSGSTNPLLTLVYTGQEDPTLSTGFAYALTGIKSQQQTSTQQIIYIAANTIPGQVLTCQADFGAFTGVCTSLGISSTGANSLVSLVRLTQIADVAKAQLP
jgi:hypothetical protein